MEHLFRNAALQLADKWTPIVDGAPRQRHWAGWLHQLYRPYRAGAKSRASHAYHSFGFAFETFPSQTAGLSTPVFGAGVYFKTPLSVARTAAITHYAQRSNDWRRDLGGAEPYLWRDLPLADLLSSPNIDAQTEKLSQFIDETFEMLNRSAPDTPPPA